MCRDDPLAAPQTCRSFFLVVFTATFGQVYFFLHDSEVSLGFRCSFAEGLQRVIFLNFALVSPGIQNNFVACIRCKLYCKKNNEHVVNGLMVIIEKIGVKKATMCSTAKETQK